MRGKCNFRAIPRILYFSLSLKSILIAFFLISLSSFVHGDEWKGFRGIEKQGRSTTSNVPLNWSEDQNILWKTAIPGQGHSSPVVTENDIYVTSAYYKGKGKMIKSITTIVVILLSLIFTILTIKVIRKHISGQDHVSIRFIITAGIFSYLMGVLLFLCVSDYFFLGSSFFDHRAYIMRWLLSGIISTLCIVLASFYLKGNSTIRIILGLFTILFSVFILLARPNPEYYHLQNSNGPMFDSIIKTFLSILIIGLVIIVFTIIQKYRTKKITQPDANLKFQYPVIILGIAAPIAFIFGLFGTPLLRGAYRFLKEQITGEYFNFPLISFDIKDFSLVIAILLLCTVLFLIIEFNRLKENAFAISYWFAVGLIALGVLSFIENNYLLVKKEYVRSLVCIDRISGEIKWVCEGPTGEGESIHMDNSYATPTPVIGRDYIYSYFGTAGLMCTDQKGDLKWINKDLPYIGIHGVGASPIYHDGKVIILNDMASDPYIIAIDGISGDPVWSTKRVPWEGQHGQHRTPFITKIKGRDVVLAWGRFDLIAYDVNTGAEIVNIPIKSSEKTSELVTSVLEVDSTLYSTNKMEVFALDMLALERDEKRILWHKELKNKGPNCSSPVINNGLMFMVSDLNHANCIDIETGEIYWSKRLPGRYHLASLNVIGNNIYFYNTDGLTTILESAKEYKVIAENYLNEPIYSSAAPVDDQLIIRTTEHLWCIQKD